MKRISRGRVLLALWSMIFVLIVPCAFAADRVRIGLSSFTPINAAVWIAEDKGLFKKYGIDPEVILIGGASAGGVSSLIAGDVQFLAGAGGAVVSAGLNGADVVMIASIVNRGVQRVMARSDIKKPEDLRGRRVGVTRLGAASHLVLLMMLRAWGMTAADVQTMQIGSSPAMMAALEKGGIDAAVLTEPTFFFAEDQGYRVLADLADMDIYYLHSMIDTTRGYIRTHRDVALRFLRGYIEGIAFFKNNRKESIEVLAKKLRTAPSQTKYLERSHALYSSGYFENTPYVSLRGVNTLLEFLGKDNPKARTADPRSFIDNSLVKELDDAGFIKKLYERER
ncbi:MAG TPA: ABC transporter substrate-binding protein [Candidatus Eisenbacteria bacterium]|nr:ABC transporter substrate-binding protein [Candidatus Eisenbacteria bacterium]